MNIPSSTERPRRILLIDDDEALLRALSETIEMRVPRVRVDVCASIALAESVIQAGHYELVICDHHLPGKDGSTFIRDILAHAPETAFVLLSGDPRLGDADWMKSDPRVHFLAKPFDRTVFIHLITDLLACDPH